MSRFTVQSRSYTCNRCGARETVTGSLDRPLSEPPDWTWLDGGHSSPLGGDLCPACSASFRRWWNEQKPE